ncbi:sugar ABC transporter ATP-binding protein [Lysinibacter cavernae]|uniref:Simple sugar transport system ATP-binding protein/ribose transport system ATP-binding protein n=1 Tax=Lysinibacter cavernae TaxID=1640652 RepID=A0A7X5R389_9MICO|nr:sugar ABC transporter ATP-binding protein [Lysinibacter cavernae]NIH54858.1 simple sugar transport system ATP-binding protein/ribose transport system ATP-binding protein [Lysinibacter cavernae]
MNQQTVIQQTDIIQLTAVSKRFGGTQALDSVDLTIRAGEVHAFVGENGAGKSTLGKVIAGVYVPDSGQLAVGGTAVGRWDPVNAQRRGVVMIAQELSLVPDLTVEQNVFLGIEKNIGGIMRGGVTERFVELEKTAQFGLDPKAKIESLRIADLQKVEILRAIARDANVIVMDEPTSSLTAHETKRLHELIHRLKARGCTIIYVSHFLDAVLEVSDRVTIMRDGKLIRTADVASETKKSIVEGMLGRALSVSFPERSPGADPSAKPLLTVEGLATPAGVHDVSFEVRPGEIVGLLGLVGSGRTEIARAIAGADRTTGGQVTFDGADLTNGTPRSTKERGLVMVPEDRHGQGLVLERSVLENVSLAFLRRFTTGGVIKSAEEKRQVTKIVGELDMRPLKVGLTVQGFSGGNQQKALLGKWLIGEPKFVILDEPTRGVDVGAKLTIYEFIADLAKQGIGVLLISSEHEEVLGLAHRAHLVSGGTLTGDVDPASTTVEEVLARLFAVEDQKEATL